MNKLFGVIIGGIFSSPFALAFDIKNIRREWTGFEMITVVVLFFVFITVLDKILRAVKKSKIKSLTILAKEKAEIDRMREAQLKKIKDIEEGNI